MAVSVVPALVDALKAAAITAGVNAYDGVHVTDDPADYLMVGVDDPMSGDGVASASSRQRWAHANHTARDEVGEVTCAAYSWNGTGDQKVARDAAYSMVEALATAVRADPDLGLSTLLWTDFGTQMDLSQDQGDWGASALVVFTIGFQARI